MRRNRIKKRHIVLLIITAFLLLLFLVLGAVSASIAAGMLSQEAADRWGAGSIINYAQISCFISVDAAFTESRISQLRTSVDSALKEASITAENPLTKLWIDTYSTETRLSAQTNRGSITASVTAVGGYFFIMHPMKYLYGYAFSPDDIMQDRVILDTDAAWQLFGSFDIAGRTLNISGKDCIVAGVTERKSDDVSDKLLNHAYGDKPRIYISYNLLESINPGTPLSCYEAVLPSPISGFALEIIQKKIGIDVSDIEIIDNSTRYDFFSLTDTIKKLPVRSMRTNRIIYPYWENIAGVTEDYLALILLIRIICASVLGTSAFITAVKFLITHPVKREMLNDLKDNIIKFISNRLKNKKSNPKKQKKQSAEIKGD
ncbi:MAG: ABC transporter permease [Eubacteriales bacterium]